MSSAATLYGLMTWVRKEGKVGDADRMMVIVLPSLMREGIDPKKVEPTTKCSATTLGAVKIIAEKTVGKPCR